MLITLSIDTHARRKIRPAGELKSRADGMMSDRRTLCLTNDIIFPEQSALKWNPRGRPGSEA
jgi:hypothetical protein